jgi:hypothetical protein
LLGEEVCQADDLRAADACIAIEAFLHRIVMGYLSIYGFFHTHDRGMGIRTCTVENPLLDIKKTFNSLSLRGTAKHLEDLKREEEVVHHMQLVQEYK